jgi:hypothetical protein
MTRLMFVMIAVGWAVLSASSNAQDRTGAVRKLTVGDVLRGLSIDESKLNYSDEPPGKLQELTANVALGQSKVNVRIEIRYTSELFSAERKWDPRKVRAAEVQKVTITPVNPQ